MLTVIRRPVCVNSDKEACMCCIPVCLNSDKEACMLTVIRRPVCP